MDIYGFPRTPGTGGSSYTIGGGLQSTPNGDGTFSLNASGAYITFLYDPTIVGSKQFLAGNNITLVQTSTSITLSAQVTGSGATSSGSYLTAITEASLPNSRVYAQGNGITIVDGGAGGNLTFSVASTVLNSNPLMWSPGDTIFPNRRTLLLGSGLSAAYGSNTLTLSVTGQNAGTVTSIDVAAPFMTSSGAVTTAGTITLSYANQAASTLLIAPSGGSGAPTFRKIVGQDIPIFGSPSIAVVTNATGGIVISSLVVPGTGTVSSVGLLLPVDTFSISNSPVTGIGTLTGAYTSQDARALHAGPSGGFGTPLWRRLVGLDLPISAGSNITLTTDATGGLSIASTASGGGGGSVTSVAQTVPPALLAVSGSPITTAGTFGITLVNAPCCTFFRGPTGGIDAQPFYGRITIVDLPSGISATSIANGAVSNAAFQFISGLTSDAQTQINGKQPLDATLTSLAAYNTNGVVCQTAADTFAGRTITGTTNRITVSNGDGVLGSPTLDIGTDVVTLTGTQTLTNKSIAGSQITGTVAAGNLPATVAYTNNANSWSVAQLPSTAGTINIGSTALPFQFLFIGGAATNNNKIASATTTGARTFTLPDADSNSVVPDTGAANNFLTAISAGGVISKAQPSFGNISGTATAAQLPSTAVNAAGTLTPLFTTSITAQTLNFALNTQASGGLALLSPASGAAAGPTFRTIGGGDLQYGLLAGPNVTLTQIPSSNQVQISSTAAGSGGGGFTANSISSSVTGVVNNSYFVDLSSSNVTFSVPTGVGQGGKEIKVKIVNNTTNPPNTLTINFTNTNGAGTCDGSATSLTSSVVNDAWCFQSANASAWYIF